MANSAFAVFNPDKIGAAMDKVKLEVLRNTAWNIRSKAIRSIVHVNTKTGKVYGGKKALARLSAGLHSKPGKPPYSSKNRINQILYEIVDENTIIVGPRQFSGGHGFTWKLLEQGGEIECTFKEIIKRHKRKFVRRGEVAKRPKPKRKQKHPRPRTDPRVHETIPGERPTGKRGPYQYFTSRERRDNAVDNENFWDWASACEKEEKQQTKPGIIAPRPFMSKAFEKEANPDRITKRLEAASRKAKLK